MLALLPAEAAVQLHAEAAVVELRRVEAAVVELPLHAAAVVELRRAEAAVVELPRHAEAVVELPLHAAAVVELPRHAEAVVELSLHAAAVVELPRHAEAAVVELPRHAEAVVELPRHAEAAVVELPRHAEAAYARRYRRRRYLRGQVTVRQEACDCREASRCSLQARLLRPWCPATARRAAHDYHEWSQHCQDRFLHPPAHCRSPRRRRGGLAARSPQPACLGERRRHRRRSVAPRVWSPQRWDGLDYC